MAKALHCSFCGKRQSEVRTLVAGPSVFICNECVDLCHTIVHEAHEVLRPPTAQDEALRLAEKLMEMGNVTCAVALALHEFHNAMRRSGQGPGTLVTGIGFTDPGEENETKS